MKDIMLKDILKITNQVVDKKNISNLRTRVISYGLDTSSGIYTQEEADLIITKETERQKRDYRNMYPNHRTIKDMVNNYGGSIQKYECRVKTLKLDCIYGYNGSMKVRLYSKDQVKEILTMYDFKVPEGYLSASAISKTIGVLPQTILKAAQTIGINSISFKKNPTHTIYYYSPEQIARIKTLFQKSNEGESKTYNRDRSLYTRIMEDFTPKFYFDKMDEAV